MHARPLPWPESHTPLMLAPMQGLSNSALRALVGQIGRPDLLFTEFVQVRPGARKPIADGDLREACARVEGIPLVVQLMGGCSEGLVDAVRTLRDRGVVHFNLNMGCPFGRMASVLAGGGMFRRPEIIAPLLGELRAAVGGSLSVKTRTGFDDPRQLLELLPIFEAAGVDFLVVHPRTVQQKYAGVADHEITREVVANTTLPVIASGDIRDEIEAARVLEHTGAEGLMLGRGAISDPLLFERIRGNAPPRPTGPARRQEIVTFLEALMRGYQALYCGEVQIVSKLKEALRPIEDPELRRWIGRLRRTRRVKAFSALLQGEGLTPGACSNES